MKIRAKRSKRNTEYELDDFLLKEFSSDKEDFIPDLELSCNECLESEDVTQNIDSPLSFLIKHKADNLSDPNAIKHGVDGYILPDNKTYNQQMVSSAFSSVANNHYNLILTESELRTLGKDLHKGTSKTKTHVSSEVKKYLLESYAQDEWANLLQAVNKSEWKKYVGKILKEKLYDSYGKIDDKNVAEALNIDKNGYLSRVKEILRYANFEDKEMTHLSPHLQK